MTRESFDQSCIVRFELCPSHYLQKWLWDYLTAARQNLIFVDNFSRGQSFLFNALRACSNIIWRFRGKGLLKTSRVLSYERGSGQTVKMFIYSFSCSIYGMWGRGWLKTSYGERGLADDWKRQNTVMGEGVYKNVIWYLNVPLDPSGSCPPFRPTTW